MKCMYVLAAAVISSFSINVHADEASQIEKSSVLANQNPQATEVKSENSAMGKISGIIKASESGKPLANAKIMIVGKPFSTVSDDNRKFELQLPVGIYDIAITHEKYGRKNNKGVVVNANSMHAMNAVLVLSGSTGAAMAFTGKSIEEQVETKREATAIMDSISTEEIAKTGDSDAGAAVKRVSGVALVGGQYAIVRGLGGRYISTQLNGGSIPSTNPLSRDVALDLFPASTLQGVEIRKSFTANLPGDSTGGSINMVTKNVPTEQVGRVALDTGIRSGVTGKDVISYKGGDTDYLGFDDGTREIPSLLNDVTAYGQKTYTVCNDTANCITPSFAADLAKSLENNYNTKNKSASPDAELGLSYGNKIEIEGAGTFGYYADANYKHKWTARQNAEIQHGKCNVVFYLSKLIC